VIDLLNTTGWTKLWAFSLAILALAGCSTTAVDPYEGFNRSMTSFNDTADKYLLKPLAQGYEAVLPDPVPNMFSNLGEPVVAVNQLLQGKGKLAANDLGRFVLNSTIGLVGLFDVAALAGLDKHDEDFAQTLAVLGRRQRAISCIALNGAFHGRRYSQSLC